METVQFAILAGLSAVSLALCAYLLMKVRTITYLLEQPVVKKMSPQLKLKPVKVDELDADSRPNPSRNNAPNASAPARGPRPDFAGGERPPRDPNRERPPRSERPEGGGERPPREGGFDRNGGDRGPRSDRGGERFSRDRGDRGGRGGGDRHERGGREGLPGREGGDRNRNRSEAPVGENTAPVEGSVRPAPVAAESSAPVHSGPALSPRRPLPSTVDHEVDAKDIPASSPFESNVVAEDTMFNRGDDSDITHGRRHQPKKKPRFDVADESEAKTEETKA
ncbi:MAG: hypothetical protein JWP91_2198 [Fibrobacteres bacterium]|nr:hypothetical protein [Fibrobacterota bacterium]